MGDDEYENDANDPEEKKKDLGALEAAKMAIKFLDQVRRRAYPLLRRRRRRQAAVDVLEWPRRAGARYPRRTQLPGVGARRQRCSHACASRQLACDGPAADARRCGCCFLSGAQAIAKMRKRRKDTGDQIDFDNKEIAYIDSEIAWLGEKKGRIAEKQKERQEERDKIAVEVDNCVLGFQTMIGNARNLNRTGAKGAKQIMAGRHVPKGLPHISNRDNV